MGTPIATLDHHRHWQERRLGRTIIKTYRDSADLYALLPNDKQPRVGPKEDPELQRQIEANEGIFEPLLVEPHPEHDGKLRIIDGDRRWTNSKILSNHRRRNSSGYFPSRLLTELSRMRNDYAFGYTSTDKGKNGTQKRRRWWPIAS